MPEQRDDHAEDQNLRQDAEGEDGERRAGAVRDDVRRGIAAEKAEHQGRPGGRRRLDRSHQVIGEEQRVAHLRHVQQQERQGELNSEADADLHDADLAPALAQEPCEAQERRDAN